MLNRGNAFAGEVLVGDSMLLGRGEAGVVLRRGCFQPSRPPSVPGREGQRPATSNSGRCSPYRQTTDARGHVCHCMKSSCCGNAADGQLIRCPLAWIWSRNWLDWPNLGGLPWLFPALCLAVGGVLGRYVIPWSSDGMADELAGLVGRKWAAGIALWPSMPLRIS